MSDTPERLTEAALRPLAENAEAHLSGVRLLADLAPVSHPGAAAMIARWDAVDAGPLRRPLWRWVLAVTLVLLSAWVLATTVNEAWRYQTVFRWLGNIFEGWPQADEVLVKGMSERDRFLLLGDTSKDSAAERLRALWDSAPDKPSYFAAYAGEYRIEHGGFPPDFLQTARRMDPENAWFTYHAAGDLAHNAVKRDRQSSQAKKSGEAPTWTIVDQARLDQAMALLREANHQQRWVNRAREFITERVPLLPQSDLVDKLASSFYLGSYYTTDLHIRYLAEAIAAKAWQLGETGDVAGFKDLLGEADALLGAFADSQDPSLIEVLLLKSWAAAMIGNLHAAADKLGLDEETTRLKRIKGNLMQHREDLNRRSDDLNQRGDNEQEMRSGFIAGTTTPKIQNLVKSPPQLTDADLKPGRMTEHLMAARACSLAVWALLGGALLAVAAFRLFLPKWLLKLAQRINALLLPVDWAWILGAGVLLPFGAMTALARCTPLGGQEWGLIKGGGAIPLTAAFLTMSLLLLVMPGLIARWRIGRRAAALGICRGGSRMAWLAVACGLALVPVLGMIEPPLANLGYGLILKASLLAPLLLVVLASIALTITLKFTRQFSRSVVALTLLPSYAFGMLLIMAAIPLYHHAQTRWERHDPLMELEPNGITRHESEIANRLLAEVRGILELDAAK